MELLRHNIVSIDRRQNKRHANKVSDAPAIRFFTGESFIFALLEKMANE